MLRIEHMSIKSEVKGTKFVLGRFLMTSISFFVYIVRKIFIYSFYIAGRLIHCPVTRRGWGLTRKNSWKLPKR